jgi:hypothetical protein
VSQAGQIKKVEIPYHVADICVSLLGGINERGLVDSLLYKIERCISASKQIITRKEVLSETKEDVEKLDGVSDCWGTPGGHSWNSFRGFGSRDGRSSGWFLP